MKVEIKTEQCKHSKILIDGQDISNRLMSVDVNLKGGYIPLVKLELAPDDIEIEGDFEVLKKIPQEESKDININININSNATIKDAEGIAKAIISNFNKSSYR